MQFTFALRNTQDGEFVLQTSAKNRTDSLKLNFSFNVDIKYLNVFSSSLTHPPLKHVYTMLSCDSVSRDRYELVRFDSVFFHHLLIKDADV